MRPCLLKSFQHLTIGPVHTYPPPQVESQQNKQDYRKLTAKVDTLTSLLLPHSSDVFGTGGASNTAPAGAASNVAGRMMGSGYVSQGSSALQSSFSSHAAHPTYAPQAAAAAASSAASASMLDLSADQWLAPSFPDLSPVRPLRQTQSHGAHADVSAASASAHDAEAARGQSARTVQPTAPVVRVTRNAPSPTASATAAAAAKTAPHTHQGHTQAAASASDFFAHARLTGSSPTDLLFSGRGHSAASPTHTQAPALARGAALSASASSSSGGVGMGMGVGSPLDRALKAGLSLRLFSETDKFTMPTSAHAHPTDIPVAASSAQRGVVSNSGSICRVPSTPSAFQAQAPTRPAGPKRGAWVEGDREELVNSQAAYTVDRCVGVDCIHAYCFYFIGASFSTFSMSLSISDLPLPSVSVHNFTKQALLLLLLLYALPGRV